MGELQPADPNPETASEEVWPWTHLPQIPRSSWCFLKNQFKFIVWKTMNTRWIELLKSALLAKTTKQTGFMEMFRKRSFDNLVFFSVGLICLDYFVYWYIFHSFILLYMFSILHPLSWLLSHPLLFGCYKRHLYSYYFELSIYRYINKWIPNCTKFYQSHQ